MGFEAVVWQTSWQDPKSHGAVSLCSDASQMKGERELTSLSVWTVKGLLELTASPKRKNEKRKKNPEALIPFSSKCQQIGVLAGVETTVSVARLAWCHRSDFHDSKGAPDLQVQVDRPGATSHMVETSGVRFGANAQTLIGIPQLCCVGPHSHQGQSFMWAFTVSKYM